MTVKQRQSLLVYLGYLNDNVDGVWGKKSKAACVEFQSDNNLVPDAICGPLTEAALKDCVEHDKWKGANIKPSQPDVEADTTTVITPVEQELTWDDIKYFKPEEFACKCGGRYCDGSVDKVDLRMVKKLDIIREHFGEQCRINSGVRCERHNAAVGGVRNSQHLYGKAADFVIVGVPARDVYNYANTEVIPGAGGLGKYPDFTHLDVRDNYSRW